MHRLPSAFEFQNSVETIRAHHWRSYTDTYKGCEFECQYCLYKGPGEYGRHVRPVDGSIPARSDLGIVDIGTTTDPYQPMEAEQKLTRSILEAAAATEIPLFVLTRGTLVLRDVDVLRDLASAGLVEVCISVITLNEDVAAQIEPGAPRPHERLRVAEQLAAHDIPVAFHVAPLIPGLDTPENVAAMGKRLAEACGSHIFSAMLGARKPYWAPFYKSMDAAAEYCGSFETFERAYPRDFDFSRGAADTCDFEYALPALTPLRDGVTAGGATYVSENYPFLTTGALEGGIYQWKLPTVYDMASWIEARGAVAEWADFLTWYRGFGPSERLVGLVRSLWESGELFLGTRLAKQNDGYVASEELLMPAQHTLVAKRTPVA
ncbi:radical SAM protein [Streptomyces sp. SL13]|uniref:Radical SAM protein n=1 Tax=Streptantibioticus silvisoli TaxID=2705255 RepID=A0AA90HA49_9ACTN|nr:radical SAM protein [Streptantibioticus silvisoli]MDI5964155.1 radical SAM protein [Streptantibioticus silvisoli]MDI5971780.1 radical SAM protein [Streptantibioticus silvisoli]